VRGSDVARAAEVFADDLLRLRSGERVLIYVDQGSDRVVASGIEQAACRAGCLTDIVELDDRMDHRSRASLLASRIKGSRYAVVCELSESYYYQTPVWRTALGSGARIYALGGLSASAFVRCVGRVDHDSMIRFGEALSRILERTDLIEIRSASGTDLTVRRSTGAGKPTLHTSSPSGFFDDRNRSTFLGGQLALHGPPSAVEGTAVIDGHLWPPEEIGPITSPVLLILVAGEVVDIGGSPSTAAILAQWRDGHEMEFQHLCFGFNPGAELSGGIVEAERHFGAVTIGLGRYPFHTDGVIQRPTIHLDGVELEKDGVFVHDELSQLANALLQSHR